MAIAGFRGDKTFFAKLGGGAALVLIADMTVWDEGPGSATGLLALCWAAMMATTIPAVRKDRRSQIALALATVMAAILAFDPGLLGWLCFMLAIVVASFLPRLARFGDAWSWAKRVNYQIFIGLFGPLLDRIRVSRIKARTRTPSILSYLPALILPLVGGTIFLLLFAIANPIISDWLESFQIDGPSGKTVLRVLFWGFAGTAIWGTLRPRRVLHGFTPITESDGSAIAGISTLSVTLSLFLFNLMFAGQNALDIAFIWSGVRLPEQYTLAEYVHRGAYPLIATTLLAGLFVLLSTRRGTPMADNRLIRGLVLVWVAQNLFLVASSIERLIKYIDSYGLTELRIAALLWMGLVGLGLILVTVRMLTGKTLSWLVNANAGAALAMIAGTAAFDLDEVAARWNVRHLDGPAGLDICHLYEQGESALLPLAELEMSLKPDESRLHIVTQARQIAETKVRDRQSHWQSWTMRNARRLSQLPDGLVMVKRDGFSNGPYCDRSGFGNYGEYQGEPAAEVTGELPAVVPAAEAAAQAVQDAQVAQDAAIAAAAAAKTPPASKAPLTQRPER